MRRLLCFIFSTFFLCPTALITSYVANRLHLQNSTRYESCPMHVLHSHGYACHLVDPQKTERIYRYINTSVMDMRAALPRLKGNTILIFGDSLSRNQFTSLACALWEADPTITENDIDINYDHNIFKVTSNRYSIEIQYSFADTLLNIHEHNLDLVLNPTAVLRIHEAVEMIFEGKFPPYRVPTVVLASSGHHYAVSKYSNKSIGIPVDLQLYHHAMSKVTHLLQSLFSRVGTPNTRLIWRAVPPRQYYHGDWNTGGKCNFTEPCDEAIINGELSRRGSRQWESATLSSILQHIAIELHTDFLDILNVTTYRCDAMVSTSAIGQHGDITDCTHYCVPGVPDVWNALLLRKFSMR